VLHLTWAEFEPWWKLSANSELPAYYSDVLPWMTVLMMKSQGAVRLGCIKVGVSLSDLSGHQTETFSN
jgi:hypothetical protein